MSGQMPLGDGDDHAAGEHHRSSCRENRFAGLTVSSITEKETADVPIRLGRPQPLDHPHETSDFF